MMEGFIEFLCGDSKLAVSLRKNIIFKIVPMLNPDGVALGNYRTGLSGRDFNR
jgi:murein tripeptide amidase MpaA